ncbi:FAD-dependent oxidoreductase [Acidocella aromatica]|uniref:UDP-galactopyranose mutase n=1 Tax=Acidocella aromatica TaxID=1303579 RepID=A0A840VR29_9PROT|nr:FAD-dependent oxidoreductase [Acidocella aromatica]MBB5374051.1 UDP-galactopyranose mutase [Acidocella aromatica]
MRILVVGAGFSGAVYARTLAEAGHDITVIDKRPHIGGNAYDFIDANGVRVHHYGPHLFHTKSHRVIDWLTNFAEFITYEHKVRALLPNGQLVPIPINLDTVNAVFGTDYDSAEEVEVHLARVALPIAAPNNAAEYLQSKIGVELTDLFFRPYTKKMWGFDLEDMASSVVKRIPLRMDRVDTYFSADETQILPCDGYTALFGTIFDHSRIRMYLSTAFSHEMLRNHDFCFNAMPIDEYFRFELGDLPYRSIRFHIRTEAGNVVPEAPVTNFTDTGPFTRETAWDALPHHRVEETGRRTLTKEEPCDYRDNGMERYYPVRTADGRYQALYEKYKEMAASEPNMEFIGRCGTYQYLDMDQVINQSLTGAERWLKRR